MHCFLQPTKSMLGIFCWRQKRGLFLSVFAFLKEHSWGYGTEKRRKMVKKEPFWAQRENPQHALSAATLQTVRDYFEKLDTKAKNTPKSKPSSSPKPRRVKPR